MPEKAWENIAMDFFGPLPNGNEIMVVLDTFSRMPIVEEVKSTGAEHVLTKLDTIISLFRIPKEIKSDNGPPLMINDLRSCATTLALNIVKFTPYHTPANGSAKSLMKNMSKVIRNAIVERKDWRQTLYQFLRSYRSTPHSTTGIPPAVLIVGENRTDRLPTIRENKMLVLK